jgi:hypothetical protein
MATESRPLDESLEQLRSRAETLVRRSDDLNRLLEKVESSLQDARIGVETIVYEPFVKDVLPDEQKYCLGWARGTKGVWSLVLRPVAPFVDDPLIWEAIGPDLDLRSASRRLRIAAVSKLEKLIELIAAEIEDRLAAFAKVNHLVPQSGERELLRDSPEEDWTIGSRADDEIPF